MEGISGDIRTDDNIYKIRGREHFLLGSIENLRLSKHKNEEVLMLGEKDGFYLEKGCYISEEIEVDDFTRMIMSWNCITPKKTYIEVMARVYIIGNNFDEWTEFFSWGKWGSFIERRSSDSTSSYAKINTDVLSIDNSNNIKGKKIQVKVIFHTEERTMSPLLIQLTAAFMNSTDGRYIKEEKLEKDKGYYKKVIQTPCISQYLREKSIASRICSPTSITMMLNRMGEKLVVEEVAWKCYDYEYKGFGNWSYNVALAGSMGYEAYVRYGNYDLLRSEINKGYPVAVSVKYSNDIENNKYPYVEGAPTITAGHLIVVCGIIRDYLGNELVVVNDPAGKDNESVRRKYKLGEFLEAWKASCNIMYVINRR